MLFRSLETERVKGLCFHPVRPWLLASFHDGNVIIYDYEVGVPLQKYTDTDKSVRSVDFHQTKPLFCTGSDDCCVRVYDYERQKLLCTFSDHIDYVRTVQFHPTMPFIVSASDDQTIRIWNYETEQSVSIISGHNHFVMSAFFHPTQPLIISASLDDTVRVWDISSLFYNGNSGLFSLTDAVLKFQQEEHLFGVNWAQWHPNRQLAVSCSDDQTIKVWKLSETDFSVIATLRSHHTNNISCALFHPTLDVIISCSEDKTVHLWDSRRFLHLAKYRRQDDRFWTLAVHPTQPLFAAGHDTGLVLFRMMRQRPTFDVSGDSIFYYQKNTIRKYNYKRQSDGIVGTTKPRPTGNRSTPLDSPPIRFSYSASHNKLLVSFQEKFEIHGLSNPGNSEERVETGKSAVWISRSQFAYFGENNDQLLIRELNGSSVTKLKIPSSNRIFSASNRTVYLCSYENVYLYDTMKRTILATRAIPDVRCAIISDDKKYVAFISVNSITISSTDLSNVNTFYDGSRIKSGAWSNNFFIYSTKTHIKYLLPNGDNGIIKSLSERVYIAIVSEKQVICLNTQAEIRKIDVDLLECNFKAALAEGDMYKVKSILKNAKLCSESIIDFLQKRGHPEVAMIFVEDPLTKFRLAIDAGDLKTAGETAESINDPSMWETLADEAMLHGIFSQAEYAIRRSGNKERLAFFYLISGQAQKLNDIQCGESLSLQKAIWTNDRKSLSTIVKDVTPSISFLAAQSDCNDELMKSINISNKVKAEIPKSKADLTNYVKDDGSYEDWPLLTVTRPVFNIDKTSTADDLEIDEQDGWGNDDNDFDDFLDDNSSTFKKNKNDENDEDINGWDDDIDIDESISNMPTTFIPPTSGEDIHEKWSASSNVPGEIAASGFFGQALNILHEQIGLINPEPLKKSFIEAYIAAHAAINIFASAPMVSVPLSVKSDNRLAPSTPFNKDILKEMINKAKAKFSKGTLNELTEAKDLFQEAIQKITLTVCSTESEVNEINEFINICRNYLICITLEITKRNTKDPARQIELCSYATHCKIDQKHLMLMLFSSMKSALKEKYYGISGGFALRLLDLHPPEKFATLAKKISAGYKAQELKAAKEGLQLPKVNYDPRNPFEVCCQSLTPLYRGTQKVKCPFCGASYSTSYQGKLCTICNLSKVGASSSGLNLLRQNI